MSKRVTALATVEVIVQVSQGTWGEDCSIGQLYRQAEEGAVNEVRRALSESKKIKVIAALKVTGMMTKEE